MNNGAGTFGARVDYPVGGPGQDLATGDFNGDGRLDLVVTINDPQIGLSLLNGNGDGTFGAPVTFPNTSGFDSPAVAAVDLNNDGKLDVVVAHEIACYTAPCVASEVISVMIGNGDGAFRPSREIQVGRGTGAAPPPTPSAPTLLSPAQDATPAQPVAFDWTDVAAATAYRIQIDDSNNFSAPLVVDRVVTASQFTASTLNAGRRHWWRVRGINSAGTAGAWSSVRRFTPGAFTQAPSLAGIALNPASVVGGNTSEGTASLTSAAPSGGAVVTLSSSNTSAATVPASVTVPAGAFSATFTVSTTSVTASTSLTISGGFGGTARSATLTVTPPPAPPPPASLSTVSVNPASVTGGASSQGTVTLTSPAPGSGFAVSLSRLFREGAGLVCDYATSSCLKSFRRSFTAGHCTSCGQSDRRSAA